MEASSLLPHVDELVMEYLLFRGFTKSFQVFSSERKRDRAKGFDVDQLITQLLVAVQTYQLETVLETWKFLNARFFTHLDASYAPTLQQLETSLLRLYVVNAIKSGRRDKAAELFQTHADELNAAADAWGRWFLLPYMERPEADAHFQVFFSQHWLEAFVTSLRNFLSLVFRHLPLPKLLAFQLTRLEEPALKMRLKTSQAEATRLRLANAHSAATIRRLEDAGRQLHAILRMLVQHNCMEHFAGSTGSSGGARHPESKSGSRGKSRERSSSYGQAASGAIGLSHTQMKELVELFGIASNEDAAPPTEPARRSAVDPQDLPRVAQIRLSEGDLSDADDEDDEDVVVMEGRSSSTASSPMLSPLATENGSLNGTGDSKALSSLSSKTSWPTDSPDKRLGDSQASLIRELNLLNDYAPTASAMMTRSRFSPDGQFLAIAKLGNTQVDVWAADPVVLSPSATIELPAKLSSLDWLGPGTHDESGQLLACTLDDGVTMLWSATGREVFAGVACSPDTQARHLTCAREAPIAACLVTPVEQDEDCATRQQVLVLHGGLEEPMQDALRVDGKQLTCLAWSSAGDQLITGSRSALVEIVDVIRPERIHRWSYTAAGSKYNNSGALAALCVSPDGKAMLSVQEKGRVVVEWAVAEVLTAASTSPAADDERGSVVDVAPAVAFVYELDEALAARDSKVDTAIRFLTTSDYFVVADASALRLFKRGERHAIKTLIPNQSSISDLDWHPELSMCCTANQDGTISLWDVKAMAT